MELVKYPNDALISPCSPIVNFNDERAEIAKEMLLIMHDNNGAGLAANQVGISKRMFVAKYLPHSVICNPEWWAEIGSCKFTDIEGCLSFPGVWVPVPRFTHIDIKYQDIDGGVHTGKLSGFEARIFQHETEHLNGKLFIDNLPKTF